MATFLRSFHPQKFREWRTRCTMQVWTVGLREDRVDGIREALEAIHDRDQDVFDAAIAQVVHHRKPEFGPFVVGDP